MNASLEPLAPKHFLTLDNLSVAALHELLNLAVELKEKRRNGADHRLLAGKSLAMIFQKPSNRTRVSFEVGMYELGGHAVVMRPEEIEMGKRETIPDVSRALSRYVSGVMLRVLKHTDIVEFARYATVPVINGLSDLHHPCQALADVLTILEHKANGSIADLKGLKVCYIGDGNNVCNSLIEACALLGMQVVVSCPLGYDPTVKSKAFPFTIVRDPFDAIEGADVVYTDVWTSMGQEAEALVRLRSFDGYAVTRLLLRHAAPKAIFMHCLPAHRGEEVEAAVVDGAQSVVFDQAENRLHAQKALLATLMR